MQLSRNADRKVLTDLIHLLDAYSVNRLLDFRRLDKNIRDGKLGKGFVEEWTAIHKKMRKMANLAGSSPDLIRLLKTRNVVRFASTVFTAIILIIALFGRQFLPLNPDALRWFVFATFATTPLPLYAEVFFLRHIAKKVDEVFRRTGSRSDWLGPFHLHLRSVTQELIDELVKIAKREGGKPKEYEIRLYTAD